MAHLSWIDLESRFRTLHTSLQPHGWIRLDYQFGGTSEKWSNVVFFGGLVGEAEFDTLCTIAGNLLLTLPATAVASKALAESNAKHRWYLALWHHMTSRVLDHKAFAGPEDKVGTIFTGRIWHAAALSATLCLRFSTVDVVQPPASRLVRFKQSPVGKFLWWFGEEPLRKALGAALVATVLALVKWFVSR